MTESPRDDIAIEALLEGLSRARVLDADGDDLGQVTQLFLDDQTHKPSWVTVELSGGHRLVPIETGEVRDGVLSVLVSRAQIAGAPATNPGEHLDREVEDAAYQHYGIAPEQAEARDRDDAMIDHVAAADRPDDGEFNNTAGLDTPRPFAADIEADPSIETA